MKILIGYDGSEHGETILADLDRAGLPENTEASVLTVADVREIPTPPFLTERLSSQIEGFFDASDPDISSHMDKYLENARSDARGFVRKIEKSFPNWRVSTDAAIGKPAGELIKKSDQLKPDLLLVGSHDRSAIGRFFLGSVSHKVLNEAGCSVRISRRKNEENAGNRVLLAVDGSANAEAAVKIVAERVWTEDTEIRLVAVDDPFTRPEPGYVNWNHKEDRPIDNEKSQQWVETVIGIPTQILKTAGLDVSHKIIWGDSANMILQEAKAWKADAIFLGARGVGRVKRFLLGSVSSRVASHAECSVEIVKI